MMSLSIVSHWIEFSTSSKYGTPIYETVFQGKTSFDTSLLNIVEDPLVT